MVNMLINKYKHHLSNKILCSFFVLTLSGCAVGPDFISPDLNAPHRWANGGKNQLHTAPDLSSWWKRFADPTLNKLIDEAVIANLDVEIALAKIKETRALRIQETGALFPSLSSSGSSIRSKSAHNPTLIDPIQTSHRGLLDASWEIDLFGGKRRSLEAAIFGEKVSEEEIRLVLQTVIGDVASTYIEARVYQARIHLARQTAQAQRATANLIRTKFQAGSASAMDLAKADAAAANTEVDIPTYQALFSKAVHRLSVLIGREPAALYALMSQKKAIPSPRSPLPKAIPAQVLETRPDIRIAEYNLARSNARVGVAVAAQYPKVSLLGNISTTSLKLGDLGKSSTIAWSIGPSLSIPLFNAGQLRAGVSIAESQYEQSALSFRQSVLKALEDVENALVSFRQERIKYNYLTKAVRNQREATQLARSLYQNGSTSFLEVLDAERSLYSSESALLQSQSNIASSYVALAKALGGGWDGL